MFLVPGKYQLGHLSDRERGRARRPWYLSQTEVPLERGTRVEGLHAGSLFWKVNLGTGGRLWVVKHGGRGSELESVKHNLKLVTSVDNWGTISPGPSEEPSRMHLRIAY